MEKDASSECGDSSELMEVCEFEMFVFCDVVIMSP